MSSNEAPAQADIAPVQTALRMAAPAPPPTKQTPPPNQSPRTSIPIDTSRAAHEAEAKKLFNPEPAKAAETVVTKEPEKAPKAETKKAPEASDVPLIFEKPKADAPPSIDYPEDKLSEPKTDDAKAGWKELKAITKAERNRAATLEAKIAEQTKLLETYQKATPADVADLERLRAEHRALSDRLLSVDLQNHPDFHKQYIAPVDQILSENKMLLSDNGIADAVDFNALLAKPRAEFAKSVSELSSKMTSFDAQTFTANMRQARQLSDSKQAALAQAGDLRTQLKSKTAQQQRQAFDSVTKDIIPAFAKQEITEGMSEEEKQGAIEYNQTIDGLRGRAEKRAFGDVTEKEVAQMAYKEQALEIIVKHGIPRMTKYIDSQNATIAELRAELAAQRGGKAPRTDGAPPADSSDSGQGKTIEQAAKELWAKARRG